MTGLLKGEIIIQETFNSECVNGAKSGNKVTLYNILYTQSTWSVLAAAAPCCAMHNRQDQIKTLYFALFISHQDNTPSGKTTNVIILIRGAQLVIRNHPAQILRSYNQATLNTPKLNDPGICRTEWHWWNSAISLRCIWDVPHKIVAG